MNGVVRLAPGLIDGTVRLGARDGLPAASAIVAKERHPAAIVF